MEHGFFDVPIEVSIRTATPDAETRYTTNAHAPNEITGTVYSAPVTVDETPCLNELLGDYSYSDCRLILQVR